MRVLCAALSISLLSVAPITTAATVVHTNQASFLSATGATPATGALPFDSNPVTSKTVGSITFEAFPGSSFQFGNTTYPGGWSSVLSGNDLALNGFESFDIISNNLVFAMGLQAHEPMTGGATTDTCGAATCIDTAFEVTVLNGATPIASPFLVNFPNDTAGFWGIQSTVPFDRIAIRDASGIDDEFFGEVFKSTTVAAIPEPSTYALMLAGLGIVAFVARRRPTQALS